MRESELGFVGAGEDSLPVRARKAGEPEADVAMMLL